MAYFKGQGGRKKGTKNKSTDLHAKCARLDVDVFEEMLKLAINTDAKKQQSKFSRFAKCAEYLYSRPKDTGESELTAEQIREWIRENNANKAGT